MSKASIFLVEDEALVRMMLAAMVEELGYRGNKYLPGFPRCSVPEH